MRGQLRQDHEQIDARTERLIVLQLIGSQHAIERVRLYESFGDIETARLEAAVARLALAGVIDARATKLASTPALQRLNRLQMICL
jgi:hypothetical protein